MGKTISSEKGKAFADGVVLFGSYILIYLYNSIIKIPVDSMTQDYPSFGLDILSTWLPMLIPFPSTIYLLRNEFQGLRKYFDYSIIILLILAVFGVLGVLLSEDISWDMSMYIFIAYGIIMILGAIFISPFTKDFLSKVYDRVKGI